MTPEEASQGECPMTQVLADDTEFEEIALKSVKKSSDGYELHREDGWSMFIENPGFEPMAGEKARFYGRGIGYVVRGVTISGRVAFYRSPEEQEAKATVERAEYAEKRRLALLETKVPGVVTPGFEWTEDMADVSGFGGGYERACRQMISQGCVWWAEHPDADPQFRGFENVYGICVEDNEDAKALGKALCGDIDPSGAMHQAAVAHIFHWRKLGSWLAYQNSLRDLARERSTADAD